MTTLRAATERHHHTEIPSRSRQATAETLAKRRPGLNGRAVKFTEARESTSCSL